MDTVFEYAAVIWEILFLRVLRDKVFARLYCSHVKQPTRYNRKSLPRQVRAHWLVLPEKRGFFMQRKNYFAADAGSLIDSEFGFNRNLEETSAELLPEFTWPLSPRPNNADLPELTAAVNRMSASVRPPRRENARADRRNGDVN